MGVCSPFHTLLTFDFWYQYDGSYEHTDTYSMITLGGGPRLVCFSTRPGIDRRARVQSGHAVYTWRGGAWYRVE